MTSSDARRARPAGPWRADPLLSSPRPAAASFERAPWDEALARPFGPWRVAPGVRASDPVRAAPALLAAACPTSPGSDAPDAAELPPADEARHDPPAADATDRPAAAARRLVGGGAGDEARIAAVEEAYARGLADGQAQARDELARADVGSESVQREIATALQSLALDPQRCFEPLRRLAIHLAEQLVRGELRLSGEAIERLVRACLEQLPGPLVAPIVSLHPDDVALLGDTVAVLGADTRVEADPGLARGSVRVAVRDSIVEDLVEHRLEALASELLVTPPAWRDRPESPTRDPQAS